MKTQSRKARGRNYVCGGTKRQRGQKAVEDHTKNIWSHFARQR